MKKEYSKPTSEIITLFTESVLADSDITKQDLDNTPEIDDNEVEWE